MPPQTSKKAQIEARRKQVANLYLKGYTQQDIATQLDISQATASRDIRTMLDRWQDEQRTTVKDAITLQLAELHRMKRKAWGDYEQADTVDSKMRVMTVLLNVEKRISDLLGLDAPKQQTVTGQLQLSTKAYIGFNPDEWDSDETETS